jgi:hypothetical protein
MNRFVTKLVIPSGASLFFLWLVQSRDLFSLLVAQASACVPLNVATPHLFVENLPVDVLSSEGKKI